MKDKIILLMVLTFFLSITAEAQFFIVASGGESNHSNGSFSSSIGLVGFSYLESDNETISEGVQHTYEITSTPNNNLKIVVNAIMYPNPTVDAIFLEITDSDLVDLSYEILDIKGRTLSQRPILGSLTTISLGGMETAIYFINIKRNGRTVNGFRVIKN